jgi:hypothetical protein
MVIYTGNHSALSHLQANIVHWVRGGSRISPELGVVLPLNKGTHGGGCAPNSERQRREASPEQFENSSANMRFPGIWE